MVSILHLKNENKTKSSMLDVSHEATLRSFFSSLINDKSSFDVFIKELLVDNHNKDTILFRQSVLNDFLSNRELLYELIVSFGSLNSLYTEYLSERKHHISEIVNTTNVEEIKINNKINLLKITAFQLKRFLISIKIIKTICEKYICSSIGIQTLVDDIGSVTESQYYERLLCHVETLGSIDFNQSPFELHVKLNDMGKISEVNFGHVISRAINKKANRTSWIKGIAARFSSPDTHIDDMHIYEIRNYLSIAITNLTDQLAKAFRLLFDKYSNIHGELVFYDSACRYCDYLQSKNIRLCFPKPTNHTVIKGCYDLVLISKCNEINDIVPNDFVMMDYTSGMIIEGNNGSGKTVYLRTIIFAHLLTQAGLPIPAKYAEISPVSNIVSIMASAEDSSIIGMGRFEKEVQQLSSAIREITPNSLVLLNEILQTTAYTEGANSLFCILKYLNHLQTKWICVTHIKQLKHMFNGENDILLATVDDTHTVRIDM